MKRVLALLLILVTVTATALAASPFPDVKETDYFYRPVLWAVENGVTTGRDDGTFAPDGPCCRADTVTFLWRLMGQPEPKGTSLPFTDVANWKYYFKPICWAVENGITNGMTETTFEPLTACTQGQLATFLWRALGQPEPQSGELVQKHGAGRFYSKASAWMEELGAFDAVGKYYPMGHALRAHMVTYMYYAKGTGN